jgi:hypothetical protein
MMIQVKGLAELQRKLGGNLPKQVAFATMQAINDTAKAVQQFEIGTQLPGKLTLRSKGSPWWKPGTRFGINIKFATKARLSAIIGSLADWLKFQEEGGTKTAGAHRLAIEAGARPSETAVLTQAIKPRSLLRQSGQSFTSRGKTRTARKSGKGFIVNTKSGPAIFIREGGGLKLMYMLKQSAKVPPVLQFYKSGLGKIIEIYEPIFNQRLQNAINTAK